MINITDIKDNYGWLTLHIENRSFIVSYLTNVNQELDKVYDIDSEGYTAKVLFFDGEGQELYLTLRKEYNNLVIIWEECTKEDDIILDRFEFNYETFCNEWKDLWNRIKDDYWKHFSLDNKLKFK